LIFDYISKLLPPVECHRFYEMLFTTISAASPIA